MYSSSRANPRQPYSWAGAPNQVSGSSSHAAAPPATAYSQTSATHAGYPNEESYAPATNYAGSHPYDTNYQHASSFQTPGNPTLHSSYDPHHDQFRATLESAFPHLHTPQIGSNTSVTGGSAHQGELANYAGDYRPAGNASGTAQTTVSSGGYAVPSSIHNNSTSDRRASVAEPSAKGQKRKSRKGTTDAPAAPQAELLGNESDEQRARKKKKAMQQRGYREKYSGTVKELEDVLPDEYKTNDPRLLARRLLAVSNVSKT
ncbi:hypothetical protein EVG20_g984 [Dentipellis fragilis]|uniref:Uncharacterized protein n=1 Tax=Dentipellis fragilis TaxID=205917 RepID=A0A4Y9ZBQ9_9AGAM|nr:hypothetical protein EVG20_g984 [Dentipellis fragilis]